MCGGASSMLDHGEMLHCTAISQRHAVCHNHRTAAERLLAPCLTVIAAEIKPFGQTKTWFCTLWACV